MAENLGMDIHVTAKGAKQVAVDLDAVTRAAENAEKAANKGRATWQQQAEAFHRNEQAVKKNAEAQKKAAEEADKMRKSMSDLLAQIDPMEKKLQELDRLEQELAKAYKLGAIEADKYSEAIKKINADRKDAVTGNKSYAQSLQEVVGALGLATAAAKGFSFLSDVTQTAARYEQLGVLMQTLGATAGYTARELEAVESSLVDMGISMIQSRDVVQSMISASMDLADATKLARLAQDAATIGGINSSEALERMIQGIQTADTQVLRNIGIVVSFEDAYTKMAASIGKNTAQLSEAEKQQARVNEVLAQAPALAGAYENSMQTAAKQAGSMERHLLNLKTRMGEVFQPLYASSIKAQSDALEAAAKNADLVSYAIAGVVAGVTALTAGIATATVGVTTFKAALDLLTRHPVILALSALSSLLAVGYLAWSNSSKEAEGYKGSLDILNGTIQEVAESVSKLNQLQQQSLSLTLSKKILEENDKIKAATDELKELLRFDIAFEARSGDFDLSTQLEDLVSQFAAGEVSANDFAQALNAAAESGKISPDAISMYVEYGVKIFEAKQEAERLTQQQNNLQEALTLTGDAARDAAGGVDEFDSAMADALKAGESYLKSLSERATVAGLDTEVAILKAREAAGQIAFADDEARQAALAHAKTLDDARAAREAANKGSRAYANSLKQEEQAYKALVKAAMPYEAAVAQLEEHITTLNKALKKGEVTQSQYAATIASLEDSYKKAVIATIPHVKAIDDEVKSTENAVRSMRQRVDTFGMTTSAIARAALAETSARIATLETIKATQQATGASSQYIEQLELEIDALKRLEIQQEHLAGLASTNERQEAEKRHYDELAAEAKRAHDEIERSLTDALMRGFESGEGFGKNFINTLKNMFASLVLRPIIQPIAQSAAGAVTSALGIGGGTDAVGMVSGVKNIWDTFSGGLTGTLATGIGKLGAKFGSEALKNFAFGLSGAQGPVQAGAANAVGLGSAVGKALPWVAGGLAAYSLISSFTNKGETRSGGSFIYDRTLSSALHTGGPSGGYGGSETIDAMTTILDAQMSAIQGVIDGVGTVNAEIVNAWGAFESSEKGRGGTFSGGTIVIDGAEVRFGTDKKGQGFGGKSGSPEEMFDAMIKDMAFSTLEAWQLVGDQMPNIIGDMLKGVDIRALSAEQADALVGQITGTVQAVNLLYDALDNLPFKSLSGLSFDLTASLMQAAGGMENLVAGIDSYYQGFYSEQERFDIAAKQLSDAVMGLGYELPETRQEFRALVESLDATDEASHGAIAGLLGLSGAAGEFYTELERMADEAINDAKSRADELAAERDKITNTARTIMDTFSKISDSISSSFMSLRERITLDIMDNDEDKYNYYKNQYDSLAKQLTQATDANMVQSIAQQMTAVAGSAYNLLDEDVRKDGKGQEFLSALDYAHAQAQQQLDKIQAYEVSQQENSERVIKEMARLTNDLAKEVANASREINAASGNMQSAAANMARAGAGGRVRGTEATI